MHWKEIARKIFQEHPDWILFGSAAVYLVCGVDEDVNDLDFIGGCSAKRERRHEPLEIEVLENLKILGLEHADVRWEICQGVKIVERHLLYEAYCAMNRPKDQKKIQLLRQVL